MTKGDDLVTPYAWKMGADGSTPVINENTGALTKREYFAAMAMQGILAHHGLTDWEDITGVREGVIITMGLAVISSDALIEALNKTEEKK